ncbi:hypothetical protein ACFONG_13125 [Uliginosibacterium paludis]|uniref:Uncharacterized protein n=1 Tax=Uliginosibacterium paludis TaxID=1615952 RepID=A0ABV2CPY7_9RHOO
MLQETHWSPTLDIGGKAMMAIKGEQAAIRLAGISVKATTVVKAGGFLGVGASIADAIQSALKAYTLVKRGDNNAAAYAGIGAAVAGLAAYAGFNVALGVTALLGPLGLLILCIGAGIVLAYLAFMAEDTPIGIWLDRSSFGSGRRPEGKFLSQRLEADALEMVGKQLVIQVEWHDTALSLETDEIEISVKRPANGGDAVVMGLRLHGESGTGDRLSSIYVHGATLSEMKSLKPPNGLYIADKTTTALSKPGFDFEASELVDAGTNKAVEDGSAKIYQWEKRFEVNTRKFERGTVYIRYFPNKTDPTAFFDNEISIAD